MEQVLAAFHHLQGSPVSFEIGSFQGRICFFVRAATRAAALLQSQLYAQYPAIDIETVPHFSWGIA